MLLRAAAVGFVLIPFLIDLTSSLLNRSWLAKPIPAELAGIYDEEGYKVSQQYNKEKSTLTLITSVFDTVVFTTFWLLGGFAYFDELVVKLGFGPILTGVLYFALLGISSYVLGLPFSIYSTFSIEARYGFNRSTACTFAKDLAKGFILVLLLGGPFLAVLLAFFMYAGPYAWVYAFLTSAGIQFIMLFLAPVCIMPFFLEMIPLPEGLAIAVDGVDKESPWIFLKRIFYEVDGVKGEKAYETRDRQYAGSDKGAKLSIWCDEGVWKITEGDAGQGDTVYASSVMPVQSPELASWQLQSRSGGGDMQEPLAQAGAGVELKMVRHDMGGLRRDLLALAQRLEYTTDKLFVIDGSTRSEHSNAFCTGFGTFRRICLYDTLLCQLTGDEIVAVLGHEIGHDKLSHVKIGLVQAMVLQLVEYFLLGQFISNATLAEVFYLPEPKVYTGMILFSVVWGVIESFITIPMTIQSRKHEYDADKFSVDADRQNGALLAEGLKKMTRNSKANLTPHPMKVFLDYSHPPLLSRVKAIEEYSAFRWGGAERP